MFWCQVDLRLGGLKLGVTSARQVTAHCRCSARLDAGAAQLGGQRWFNGQGAGYSFKRWRALRRFIDDGRLSIDNDWIENQMRPIAIGRIWLFAGSLPAGQRAAAVMSLTLSAKLNGYEPHAYLCDVL